MKRVIITLFTSVLILSTFAFVFPINDVYAKSDKVSVCHIPLGNPDNAHTISISENAVESHLTHGDFLGTCEDGPDCVNYPDQSACEIKDNLIINLVLENGEIPTNADCRISLRPTNEIFTMNADINGVVVFQIPEGITDISGICLDRDSSTFKRFGSPINPLEITIIDLVLIGI